MSSDDLPPPPPHLAALSQELELDEQVRSLLTATVLHVHLSSD